MYYYASGSYEKVFTSFKMWYMIIKCNMHFNLERNG